MVTESEYGREKIIHPIQMKIFQRNNYKTPYFLNWPYFDNEPGIQKRTHLYDLQPHIYVFTAYPTYPSTRRIKNPVTHLRWKVLRKKLSC